MNSAAQHLGHASTSGTPLPSLFEVTAEAAIHNLIHPAIDHALQVRRGITSSTDKVARQSGCSSLSMQAGSISTAMNWHCSSICFCSDPISEPQVNTAAARPFFLHDTEASLSESFYGLKRVATSASTSTPK